MFLHRMGKTGRRAKVEAQRANYKQVKNLQSSFAVPLARGDFGGITPRMDMCGGAGTSTPARDLHHLDRTSPRASSLIRRQCHK